MRTLVTGANGFVGAALMRTLLGNQQHEVRGSVRQFSEDEALKARQLLVGDLSPDTDWTLALEGIDVVVHTAARVHVMTDAQGTAISDYRNANALGTTNLVRQAAAAGVSRVVFISSVKVNGERTDAGSPFRESDPPRPVDPYGMSKYEAECGLKSICQETGMEYVILRPAIVYGPCVRANFESLMRLICMKLPLPLAGIRNRRSMIALDNLLDLIVSCITAPTAANEVFFASDGCDLSTTDLVIKLARALQTRVRLFYLPPSSFRAMANLLGRPHYADRLLESLQVNIDKARHAIPWEPKVGVEEGLASTAQWYLESRR